MDDNESLEFMLSPEGVTEFLNDAKKLSKEELIELYAETHRMAAKTLLEYRLLARQVGII